MHTIIAVLYIWPVAILLLLGISWRRGDKSTRTALVVPALSTMLFSLAYVRTWKWALLGPDYSRRLYVSIGVNLFTLAALCCYRAGSIWE